MINLLYEMIESMDNNDYVSIIISIEDFCTGEFVLSGNQITFFNDKIHLMINENSDFYIPLGNTVIVEYDDETETFDIKRDNITVSIVL